MVNSTQPWRLRGRDFSWGDRTYLMGILNLTPDSFSDGGQFNALAAAVPQAKALAAAGMDILDLGGQSTRPQAVEVSLETELERVIPVIEAVRSQGLDVPISIDTTRAEVAARAIAAGADLVNDVSGAMADPEMLPIVARLGVPIILMHRRGNPRTMQQLTEYQDLVTEVYDFLADRAQAAIAAGVRAIAIDPGIGFAKTATQSLQLLQQLSRFQNLGYPILVGPSRKSFIGQILDQPDPKQRLWGTAAACCGAIAGGADILRVHDGAEMRDVCRVADALWRRGPVTKT
ncbi:MAG: dihydropteroate synthase [Aphanocapsa sp. GSE-SYN-MK-11-07L]|jgi:dihydropteroate synthase|nr:dihydropteroate synthase [Aphanocapsa sp. GSE-SYN-MK-11-07L]